MFNLCRYRLVQDPRGSWSVAEHRRICVTCSKQHTLRIKTLQKVMIRSAVVENYTGRSLARGNRKAGVTKNVGVAFQTWDLVKHDAVNSTHMTRKRLHQKDYSAISSPILGTRMSHLGHEGLR